METKYTCPHCGQHVVLDAATPGVTITCPNCRVAFALPAPSSGSRGLGSPWIWCVGALIAIGITYPLLFKSGSSKTKSTDFTPAVVSKPTARPATSGNLIEGKSVDQWVDELKSLETPVANRAQKVIRSHGGEMKAELVRIVKDTRASGKHRGNAAEALGYVIKKTDSEIQVLLVALRDRNKDTRSGSSTALRRLRMDASAVVPILIELADSPDTDTRQTAAFYLAELGAAAADALPAVQKLAGDENAYVRKSAVVALARLTAAVTDLGDYDPAVQTRAQGVIREIGPAAIPELVAVLENKQSAAVERSLAANALGFAGGNGDAEIKALFAAVRDPEIIVRARAITSVGLLHPDPKILVPLCMDVLSDSDGGMRRRSARILAKLGDDARAAVPQLKHMAARDTDKDARIAAMDAVKKLGTP